MGLTKEVKIHYTCDSKKCITHPKQSMPGLLKSLLCPQCVAKMCSILNGKREDKEVAA